MQSKVNDTFEIFSIFANTIHLHTLAMGNNISI